MLANVWPSITLRLPLQGVLPTSLMAVGIMRMHGATPTLGFGVTPNRDNELDLWRLFQSIFDA